MTNTDDVEEKKAGLRARLQQAVELELSTLPPYLTALWSIRPGTNLDATVILRSVMMEEMLYMTLAANVLTAVGGKVRLGADSIPSYPLQLDFDSKRRGIRAVDIHLEAFSASAVHTFMQIELPDNFAPAADGAAAAALPVPAYTVGDFYQEIIAELHALHEQIGPTALFSGNPTHQIAEQYYWRGGGRPIAVTDLGRAEEAIKTITAQGEGADGTMFDGDRHFFGQPEEVAHYFRFNQIRAGRYYARGDSIHDRPSGPVLPVDYKEVLPIKSDCRHADFRDNAELAALNDRFNASYSMMLTQLAEGFGGHPPLFYTAIMNGMLGLSEIARTMVQLPLAGDAQQRNASPSFEWNSPSER
jgi:hypothetical protein